MSLITIMSADISKNAANAVKMIKWILSLRNSRTVYIVLSSGRPEAIVPLHINFILTIYVIYIMTFLEKIVIEVVNENETDILNW